MDRNVKLKFRDEIRNLDKKIEKRDKELKNMFAQLMQQIEEKSKSKHEEGSQKKKNKRERERYEELHSHSEWVYNSHHNDDYYQPPPRHCHGHREKKNILSYTFLFVDYL